MRRISLRSTKNAGGATTKLKNDISGSCTTITAIRPISDSRSRPTEVISRLMTCVAAAAPVGQPRDEFGRVPVGEEADALVEQLGEHAPLVVGDDAVADLRQQHAVAVGGDALDREQRDRDAAEHDDAGKIVVDVSLR